jgi:hypothetical protein
MFFTLLHKEDSSTRLQWQTAATETPQPGGSGIGRNNVAQRQNDVIDPAASKFWPTQNVAAQLAQQILANTNVTLKQEVIKIPEFFVKKPRKSSLPRNSSRVSMNVRFQTTGMTQPLLRTSGFSSEVKLKNGFLLRSIT